MANYNDVIQILKNDFNDLNGKKSLTELNDRLYIEIQNDSKLLKLMDKRDPASIWQAIQIGSCQLISGILKFNEKPAGVNFLLLKQAIKAVFNVDFVEAFSTTFNWYYKTR